MIVAVQAGESFELCQQFSIVSASSHRLMETYSLQKLTEPNKPVTF
jgi:hypothetical protein